MFSSMFHAALQEWTFTASGIRRQQIGLRLLKNYLKLSFKHFPMSLCRLCLIEKTPEELIISLTDDIGSVITFKQFVEFYCHFVLDTDPELPQKICTVCRDEICKFAQFCHTVEEKQLLFNRKSSIASTENCDQSKQQVWRQKDENGNDAQKLSGHKEQKTDNKPKRIADSSEQFKNDERDNKKLKLKELEDETAPLEAEANLPSLEEIDKKAQKQGTVIVMRERRKSVVSQKAIETLLAHENVSECKLNRGIATFFLLIPF